MKFLHEKLSKVLLNETLTNEEQLQVFLNGLKDHTSNLEATILKDVEKRVEEKR